MIIPKNSVTVGLCQFLQACYWHLTFPGYLSHGESDV